MKEVFKNIYTFEVTLPKSPLKEINSYVILGNDRNILLDTGYNMPESKEDLINGLKELSLDITDVDVVLTHVHADHTGLVNLFSDAGCKIYAGKICAELTNQMATGEYWDMVDSFRKLYNISDEELSITDNPGYKFKLDHSLTFEILDIGSNLNVGEYSFEIVDLKGHTPGHIGLLEKKHKFLFGADTVLDPITPNITFWTFKYKDILGTYISTLKKVRTMDLDIIFPTHRKIIYNPKERIDELINHHYLRMQEILDSMNEDRTYCVREISSKITWKIKADGWNNFPKPQKWFVAGETMSHIDHLVNLGYISMKEKNGTLFFKKIKNKLI